MYTCVIVEDDPVVSKQMKDYFERSTLFANVQICRTAVETFAVISKSNVDLIMLNYDLPEMSGAELLGLLPHTTPVIISTVHAEYAVNCYDLDQVADFLVRPYGYSRFLRAVRRALAIKTRLEQPAVDTKPTSATSTTDTPAITATAASSRKYIYFKSGRVQSRFALDDILYAEAFGAFVRIYSINGVQAINMRMSTLEKELPSDQFLRIHKSFIINSQHLARLETQRIIIGPAKLPIGITYRPIVMDFMQRAGIL